MTPTMSARQCRSEGDRQAGDGDSRDEQQVGNIEDDARGNSIANLGGAGAPEIIREGRRATSMEPNVNPARTVTRTTPIT